MSAIGEVPGARVHCCDWRDLAAVVRAEGGCDLLCTDTPYSVRTHSGHDAAICDDMRRDIAYEHWTPAAVAEFVEAWHPLTRGWFVSITDHVLARAWEAALEATGRYVFPPLPFVAPGSRVRLAGDGPSCWTTQIVVARPRNKAFASWGTLPGAYILPPGYGGAMPVVGGKPPWLLTRLVEDYSRPGDLCVDPCCGSGTLAVAALRTGRRAIVGDALREHAELAAHWVRNPWGKAPRSTERDDPNQPSLFAGLGGSR